MKLYGLSMVRNEADIISVNVRCHLAAGFDRMLIVDNGSDEILRELDKDERVRCTRDASPSFRQGEVFTELAREAYAEGADWTRAQITTSSVLYRSWFKKIPWDIRAYQPERAGRLEPLPQDQAPGPGKMRYLEPLLKHYRERSQSS